MNTMFFLSIPSQQTAQENSILPANKQQSGNFNHVWCKHNYKCKKKHKTQGQIQAQVQAEMQAQEK